MCTLGTEKLKSEQLAVVSARYGTPEVEAYRYATPVKLSPPHSFLKKSGTAKTVPAVPLAPALLQGYKISVRDC